MEKIPIIILGKTKSGKINHLFQQNQDFLILRSIIPGEIKSIAKEKKNFPDVMVIIDITELPTRPNVISSILLRNAGFQVFLSCERDFFELIEVVKDIHKFIKEQILQNNTYRTEIIITKFALETMGNIQPIIDEFDKDVNNLKAKLN